MYNDATQSLSTKKKKFLAYASFAGLTTYDVKKEKEKKKKTTLPLAHYTIPLQLISTNLTCFALLSILHAAGDRNGEHPFTFAAPLLVRSPHSFHFPHKLTCAAMGLFPSHSLLKLFNMPLSPS